MSVKGANADAIKALQKDLEEAKKDVAPAKTLQVSIAEAKKNATEVKRILHLELTRAQLAQTNLASYPANHGNAAKIKTEADEVKIIAAELNDAHAQAVQALALVNKDDATAENVKEANAMMGLAFVTLTKHSEFEDVQKYEAPKEEDDVKGAHRQPPGGGNDDAGKPGVSANLLMRFFASKKTRNVAIVLALAAVGLFAAAPFAVPVICTGLVYGGIAALCAAGFLGTGYGIASRKSEAAEEVRPDPEPARP